MPPQGQVQGRYYGANAAHRSQIRQAFRLVARQCQLLGTRVSELERRAEEFRDRATLPSPEQVRAGLGNRWQPVWDQMKATEKNIKDLFDLFY